MSNRILRALPVVDDGRLRGLLTRLSCLRAVECVTRTEDPCEFDYLVNRLKVKDVMLRNPQTVDLDDPIGDCLRRGQEAKIGQYPVMNGDSVVGLVSASEILTLAAELIGAMRESSSISVGPMTIGQGTLGEIARRVEAAGAMLEAIFTVARKDDGGQARVVVNFSGAAPQAVAAAVTAGGFRVFEASAQATHAGFATADQVSR